VKRHHRAGDEGRSTEDPADSKVRAPPAVEPGGACRHDRANQRVHHDPHAHLRADSRQCPFVERIAVLDPSADARVAPA